MYNIISEGITVQGEADCCQQQQKKNRTGKGNGDYSGILHDDSEKCRIWNNTTMTKYEHWITLW